MSTEVELLRDQLAAAKTQLADSKETAAALYKAMQLQEKALINLESELDKYRQQYNILRTKWIKCSERMPPDEGMVWMTDGVVVKLGCYDKDIDRSEFNATKWAFVIKPEPPGNT